MNRSWVAIACGGTGGHLFPGIAVADELLLRGQGVMLLVSGKDLDQQIVKDWTRRVRETRNGVNDEAAESRTVITALPAVGLQTGNRLAFVRGFVRSYFEARRLFAKTVPEAVLGMGGFTSAPAILAAKRCGIRTFIHESNRVAGRANRWLSRIVNGAFVGFPNTHGLRALRLGKTGTPVRTEFDRAGMCRVICRDRDHRSEKFFAATYEPVAVGVGSAFGSADTGCFDFRPMIEAPLSGSHPSDRESEHLAFRSRTSISASDEESDLGAHCRTLLGLDGNRPLVVVVGGSQGASGLNQLVMQALPVVAMAAPDVQWFHLAGPNDVNQVQAAYDRLTLRAIVQPFFSQMELALGAATVAVSRAGASSLAELAAMRVPTILVPYPAATDNHQYYNARAFVRTGAGRMLQQKNVTGEELAWQILGLLAHPETREHMQQALGRWHSPRAAEEIVEGILQESETSNCAVGRSL
jgi:undecaprenyldiphospho-muramoylpentapeptide beta-N-acetylglucosaminyltransferase